MKTLNLLLPLFAFAAAAQADTYYWINNSQSNFNTASNWATDKEGSIVSTVAPPAGSIIDIANSVSGSNNRTMMGFDGSVELAGINNTGSLAMPTGVWEIYSTASGTWTLGDITQDSSTKLTIRKRASDASLAVKMAEVNVNTGTLNVGTTSTDTAVNSLDVSGGINILSGAYFYVYATDSFSVAKTVENYGCFELAHNTTFDHSDTQFYQFGNINGYDGSSFRLNSYAGADMGVVNITNGSLQIWNKVGAGAAANQEFTAKSIYLASSSTTSNLILGFAAANYAYDAEQSLKKVSVGDLYYSLGGEMSSGAWSIDNLVVKANALDGTTGTMTITSELGKRARMLIQNLDVDNLIVGEDGMSSIVAFEMSRGSNAVQGSAEGSVKIGSLDIKDNIANFRLGYLYAGSTAGMQSYTKYKTIDIGSMSISKTGVLVGETINIGSLTKIDTVNALDLGTADNFVTTLTLGADTTSQINNYGGQLTLFAKDLVTKGTINLAPAGTNDANIYLNNAKNYDGTYADQTVNMDTISFNTVNANATLSLSPDSNKITTINIDKILFSGANTGMVKLKSQVSTHIGSITVNPYLVGETLTNSFKNYIVFYGAGAITVDEVHATDFDSNSLKML